MTGKTKPKSSTKKPSKAEVSQDEKRSRAQDLYLNTDLNQKRICEIVGWTEKTFKDNKDKYGWQSLKGAQTITANSIVSKLYIKIDKLVSDDSDSVEADKLIKIAKSIEYLSNKKVTLSQHINCAKELLTYAFGKNPELTKQFSKIYQDFINEKGSDNG